MPRDLTLGVSSVDTRSCAERLIVAPKAFDHQASAILRTLPPAVKPPPLRSV